MVIYETKCDLSTSLESVVYSLTPFEVVVVVVVVVKTLVLHQSASSPESGYPKMAEMLVMIVMACHLSHSGTECRNRDKKSGYLQKGRERHTLAKDNHHTEKSVW